MRPMSPQAQPRRLSLASARRRATAGFSLTELLVTLIVVALVTSLAATAIPSAWVTYTRMVNSSNAQVLLSTTASVLRDELDTALNLRQEAAGTLTYTSSKTGLPTTLQLGATHADGSHQGIVLQTARDDGSVTTLPVVSDAAAPDGLYSTYDNLTLDASHGIVGMTLRVCQDTSGGTLTLAQEDLTFRALVLPQLQDGATR